MTTPTNEVTDETTSRPTSQPAGEAKGMSSLLGSVPESLRGPFLNLLVSGPILTVGLYVFGRRFTRRFYWRFGINDAALDFSVQDYVIRSEAAFFELVSSMGWTIVLVALGSWTLFRVVRTCDIPRLVRGVLLTIFGIVGGVVALITRPETDDVDTTLLWWFALGGTVAIRATIALIHDVSGSPPSFPVQLAASVAMAALLVVALTEGAQREGLRFACERERDRHLSQPVTLLAPAGLNVGSMEPWDDRVLHTDLRLFNKTPAGYLVFGANKSPSASGLTLVPADPSITVQFMARHEPLVADPGVECTRVLGTETSEEGSSVAIG